MRPEPKFKQGDIVHAHCVIHLVTGIIRYDNDMGEYLYALIDDMGTSWFGWEKDLLKVGERH